MFGAIDCDFTIAHHKRYNLTPLSNTCTVGGVRTYHEVMSSRTAVQYLCGQSSQKLANSRKTATETGQIPLTHYSICAIMQATNRS